MHVIVLRFTQVVPPSGGVGGVLLVAFVTAESEIYPDEDIF